MGLSRAYWRKRKTINASIALSMAASVSHGHAWGLPAIFRGDDAAFAKGAELMLSIGSSLLGFIIAAVTLIYALTANERFALLRASRSFSDLAAASKSAMFWLLTASILGATLLPVDPGVFALASKEFIFGSVFVTTEVAVSTAALTWIISRLISLT